MKPFFHFPVIKYHIETARHSHDQLMQQFMSMPASLRSAGHVIKIIDSSDVKRHMMGSLDKCQITPWIRYLGQFNQATLVYAKIRHGTFNPQQVVAVHFPATIYISAAISGYFSPKRINAKIISGVQSFSICAFDNGLSQYPPSFFTSKPANLKSYSNSSMV
jgi:hypothetical protein